MNALDDLKHNITEEKVEREKVLFSLSAPIAYDVVFAIWRYTHRQCLTMCVH
jgi:hypothetical protein